MTNLALNPFKKGKKAEVESIKKVEVEGDSEVNAALQEYIDIRRMDLVLDDEREAIKDLDKIILEPKKIDKCLQNILRYEKNSVRISSYFATSRFISKLVRESYESGSNNFKLHVTHPLTFLCNNLKGKEDNPLTLKIYGNVGNDSFYGSEYVVAFIRGNVGKSFAHNAKNSKFYIKGNFGKASAWHTKDSLFKIKGNMDEYLGFGSKKSTFVLDGEFPNGGSSNVKDCIFASTDEEKVAEMKKKFSIFNDYLLIDRHGKILDRTIKRKTGYGI